MLFIKVLGGLSLTVDGEPIEVRGAQRRRVLALLSANAPAPVSTLQLAGCLDVATNPTNHTNAVQAQIRRIRQILEPGVRGADSRYLRAVGDGYALHPDDMDLWATRRLAERARECGEADPSAAIGLLTEALETWDEPWGELGSDPLLDEYFWVLDSERLDLEDRWIAAVSKRGASSAECDRAVSLAKAEPMREHRSIAAMSALFQVGRQAEALRLYDTTRRFLRDELGLVPSPELEAMYLRVLRHDLELRREPPTLQGSPPQTSHNPLVGRESELLELGQLQRRHEIVTVTGPAGVGKTRLVHHWLRSSAAANTAIWLELNQYSGDTLVHDLGDALGVGNSIEFEDRFESICLALPTSGVLIVLDGVDENREAAIELIVSLSDARPLTRFVVTSPTPLGIPGEQVLALGGLRIPDPGESTDGTALQLARDRLGAHADESSVRRAALAGGGIPYAIELVANAMADGNALGNPGRHLAIAEAELMGLSLIDQVLDTSLTHLSPSARWMLELLAVLPDGVGLDAAEWHCAQRRDPGVEDPHEHDRVLGELVRAQLVGIEPGKAGLRYVARHQPARAMRRRIHEDRAEELHRANAGWITHQLAAVGSEAPMVPNIATRTALLRETTNMALALDYLDRHQPGSELHVEALISIVPCVARLTHRRTLKALLRRALASDLKPVDRLRLTLCDVVLEPDMAAISVRRGDLEEILEELPRTDLHPHWTMAAHVMAAIAAGWTGDLQRASDHLVPAEEAAAASEWAAGTVCRYRSALMFAKGQAKEAVELAVQASEVLQACGDDVEALGAMHFAAVASVDLDDTDTGELLRKAEELNGDGGSVFEPLLRAELARYSLLSGADDTEHRYRQAVESLDSAGLLRSAAAARARLGIVRLEAGKLELARDDLLRSATALLRLDPTHAAVALGGLSQLAAIQIERGDNPVGSPTELADLALQLLDADGVPLLDFEVSDIRRQAMLARSIAEGEPTSSEPTSDVILGASRLLEQLRTVAARD